ncbi:MAG: NepR family anti-sigma factor [Hyphomonadaceae bacterium]|nr:NepR family anti-sigma factor [Hyphomonadaceae bacterium]
MTNNALPSAQHRVDWNRQKQLGKALKRLYSDVSAEPVPGDLMLLLAEADRRRMKDPKAK